MSTVDQDCQTDLSNAGPFSWVQRLQELQESSLSQLTTHLRAQLSDTTAGKEEAELVLRDREVLLKSEVTDLQCENLRLQAESGDREQLLKAGISTQKEALSVVKEELLCGLRKGTMLPLQQGNGSRRQGARRGRGGRRSCYAV